MIPGRFSLDAVDPLHPGADRGEPTPPDPEAPPSDELPRRWQDYDPDEIEGYEPAGFVRFDGANYPEDDSAPVFIRCSNGETYGAYHSGAVMWGGWCIVEYALARKA